MRRAYLIASLAAAAVVVALLAPSAALAGTYTWSMPQDFTATAPGANPDHDSYGASPWSYVQATKGLLGSIGPYSKLPTFSGSIAGGLSGWTDTSTPNEWVAKNTTGSTLASVPAGALALNPDGGKIVALAWTSPLAKSATVNISGSITALGSCLSWSLDKGSSTLTSGVTTATISQSTTVSPGQTIYLVVDNDALIYDGSCARAATSLQITAQSTAPAPTLDSPANGSLISGAQPTFSGKADTSFGTSNQITVNVYAGFSAAGTPVRSLTTTSGSDGSYSVSLTTPLPDGEYTAQAQQGNQASPPDVGKSNTTTFTLHNAPPSITLDSPGSKPLLTATPTFTGVAGSSASDSGSVVLLIYPGTDTKQSPVRQITASRDSSGHFSIQVTPALPDGQYTALAAQASGLMIGTSNARPFRIKVHGPALTLTEPASGASVKQQAPTFSGAAGDALGDAGQVSVVLFSGHTARGKPIGTMTVTRTGATWSGTWPKALKLGFYTAEAKQSDDAGHTTVTPSRTFLIVRGPTAIGTPVTLARRGGAEVSVPIACLAPSDQTCTGDVLILTVKRYRPVPGGPSGQLRVLFAYVSIPGGKTAMVRGPASAEVSRMLRHSAPLKVSVSADLTSSGSTPARYSAIRTLRLS